MLQRPGSVTKELILFLHLAFREVFDLFDSNGSGTIDAQELDEALRSADIHLTKEEIADVLTSMDKDGKFIVYTQTKVY